MRHTLKILIADDHELYRDGLCNLITETLGHVEVLQADCLLEAQKQLQQHPDTALLLLDIHMPDTRGLDGLKQIKQTYPILPLVVVSSVDYHASIDDMLALGADGFISKSSSKDAMIKALKDIINGEKIVVSEQCTDSLIKITARQSDILEVLAEGASNKEIAKKLNISASTVRDYISEILYLFDCENRTQLVLKVKKMGYFLD